MKISKSCLLIFLIGFASFAAWAQTAPANKEAKESKEAKDLKQVETPAVEPFAEVRKQLRAALPFQPGEQLRYELNLSRFPIYGTIGVLTFNVDEEAIPAAQTPEQTAGNSVTNSTAPTAPAPASVPATPVTANGANPVTATGANNDLKGNWKILVQAESKGLLTSLFRIHVDDRFTSLVDKLDFGVTKTTKQIDEGKRHREMVADFDRARQRVKFVDIDLTTNKAVQIKDNPSPNWVTDIASGWYVMRAQPLSTGKTFTIPISDNGEIYNIDVEVQAEEKLETDLGKFDTFKIEMKIFDGKFIRRKGRLILWVTRDERHIPLRAQIKSNFGTVTATLIEMKNVKKV